MTPRNYVWSKLGSFLFSARFQALLRAQSRLRGRLRGRERAVHYFHEVDDPYSHLAVQKLDALRDAYTIPFVPHLVSQPSAPFLGSSAHFDAWARRDAASIAGAYGVRFPPDARKPEAADVARANAALAAHVRSPEGFAEAATQVGEALWSGRPVGDASVQEGERAVREGNRLRRRWLHYAGGMFHYEGEWYWGLDRLRLLERRLQEEGLARRPGHTLVPEPTPTDTTGWAASDVVLEYFFSLRSPYTAVGHASVLDLVERSGVTLRLRPVLPMMMRGIPAPRTKQLWIITDAGRESRARGVAFGNAVDPIGEPIRRAFALYPGAVALGRELPFVTEYLHAAWAEAIDITTDAGLALVARRAGMDWDALRDAARGHDAQGMLDANLDTMLEAGLWGVPSFRVSGGKEDHPPFACWGQDRVWRVEEEIARRATPRG